MLLAKGERLDKTKGLGRDEVAGMRERERERERPWEKYLSLEDGEFILCIWAFGEWVVMIPYVKGKGCFLKKGDWETGSPVVVREVVMGCEVGVGVEVY
ncbi:hypothetical protein VTJ04DRAFT_8952 [Mycothermus thermophilus]|uniref:uncharacterized protein n=1 Tax=Humicola insolens TaxID=85995 RepID=UPI003743346F